jgi:hypothetical protein
MEDDFNDRGFLSEHILNYRKTVLEKHKRFFRLVENLNVYSQKKKFNLQADRDNGQQVLALSLLAKILNDVQSVYILCSYGITQQSRIVLRSTLEGFFLFAKIASDPSFVNEYIQADLINRINIMKASQKYPGGPFADVKSIATDGAIQELEKQRKDDRIHRVFIEEVANSVGLGVYYDSVYRLFSQDVHVQARSLEEYVSTDNEGNIASIEWGPIDHLFHLGVQSSMEEYKKELVSIQQESSVENSGRSKG